MLIGNLGSVLAGAPLSLLAQATGWRGVFVGVGFVSLALAALCWLLVRDRRGGGRRPATRRAFDRTVVLTGLLTVLQNRATWPAAVVNFGLWRQLLRLCRLVGDAVSHPGCMGMSRAVASSHLSLYFAGFAARLPVHRHAFRPAAAGASRSCSVSARISTALIWLVWLAGVSLPLAASYALFALMGAGDGQLHADAGPAPRK